MNSTQIINSGKTNCSILKDGIAASIENKSNFLPIKGIKLNVIVVRSNVKSILGVKFDHHRFYNNIFINNRLIGGTISSDIECGSIITKVS